MKIVYALLRTLRREARVAARVRDVEEQRALETTKGWARRGGPMDAGFVA